MTPTTLDTTADEATRAPETYAPRQTIPTPPPRPLRFADFFSRHIGEYPRVSFSDLYGFPALNRHPSVTESFYQLPGDKQARHDGDGKFVLPSTVVAEAVNAAAERGGALMGRAMARAVLADMRRRAPMPGLAEAPQPGLTAFEESAAMQTPSSTTFLARLFRLPAKGKTPDRKDRSDTAADTRAADTQHREIVEALLLARAGAALWNAVSITGPSASYDKIEPETNGWRFTWAGIGADLTVQRDGTLWETPFAQAQPWAWKLHGWRGRLSIWLPTEDLEFNAPTWRERAALVRQAREDDRAHTGNARRLPPRFPWDPTRRRGIWSARSVKTRLMAWILAGLHGPGTEAMDLRPLPPLDEESLAVLDHIDRAATSYRSGEPTTRR